MRVSLRITALAGLFLACLTFFPRPALSQDRGDEGRGGRESRDNDDDDDDEGPRRGRGGFGGPGGGGPWGGGGPGGGGPWGGGGPGGGQGGNPWGGRGGGPGGGGPWGGGGREGGGGGGPWGGGGGGGPWGGGGGGPWGGRGGEEGGRRGRGGFGGGGGFGGFNPADMFARQDRNGDGQVTMDELDERTRGFMQRMAQNSGLPENGPWKIDEIRKSFEDRAGGGDREGRDRGEGDRGRDGDRDSKEGDAEAKKPLVPGFGIASLEGAAGRLVPGFGATKEENGGTSNRTFGALARTSGGERSDERRRDSGSSSSGGGSSSSAKKPSSKAEEDAMKMIKGNDANNDGKLQPEEMDGMFYKPKDTNGDGAVTLDELTASLAKTSGGKTADAKKEGGGGGRDRDRGSSDSDSGSSSKSFRFLTAKERLPSDIPDWFVDADEDEDGQVLMSEYAERWTESVAKKFVGLDLDGDGVITPDEATSGRKSRDR